jgi:hypothetical protein
VTRLCERPGCSAPAAVGYGFDAKRHLVFLDVLRTDEGTAIRGGVLCETHAAALTPPLGWWLDDFREHQPGLFGQQRRPQPIPPKVRRPNRPSPRRRHADATSELPFELTTTEPLPATGLKPQAGGPEGESVAQAAVPWIPVFDRGDDLDGLLSARTPLLSRAFGAVPKR